MSVIDNNTLSGIVDSIIYRNSENGYTVCEIETPEGLPVTAVGITPYINEGDKITAKGNWTTHKTYGKQFSIETYESSLPSDENEMLRYLSSGAIKGIGPKTAQKIVEKFGNDTFDVLENNPHFLSSIPGISAEKAADIGEQFSLLSGAREFMLFSGDFFTTKTAMKIYKKWGTLAVKRIQDNPYSLINDFSSIGFKRADLIAKIIGIKKDSSLRIKAGVMYVLANEGRNGHSCLPYDTLIQLSTDMLSDTSVVISEGSAEGAIELLENERKVFIVKSGKEKYVYHYAMYHSERRIASSLSEINEKCPSIDDRDIGILTKEAAVISGTAYAEKQIKAIYESFRNGVSVVTGGPGTGKTTILKALIYISEKLGLKISLAAPTGRAAKKMSETTSYEAKTIHRMLEMVYSEDEEPRFDRDENNPLDSDIIIVDEASMIDIFLFSSLLRAIRPRTRLVIIGDSDQLPSVGCGNVLRDIINSGTVRVTELSEIFRQSNDSSIIENAHLINKGIIPDLSSKSTDFFFLKRNSDDETLRTICDLIRERLPKAYGKSITDKIQIITPSRKGTCGTDTLNKILQEILNPPSDDKNELKIRDVIFREGDKVMQNKNNYNIEWEGDFENPKFGVFNGDIGYIMSLDKEAGNVKIKFEDKICNYSFDDLEEIEHAYSITIHKSQGSEYPVVIIPLCSCFEGLQTRNILYTAITRAEKMVILAGSELILSHMVKNNYKTERCTCLCEMLRGKI